MNKYIQIKLELKFSCEQKAELDNLKQKMVELTEFVNTLDPTVKKYKPLHALAYHQLRAKQVPSQLACKIIGKVSSSRLSGKPIDCSYLHFDTRMMRHEPGLLKLKIYRKTLGFEYKLIHAQHKQYLNSIVKSGVLEIKDRVFFTLRVNPPTQLFYDPQY